MLLSIDRVETIVVRLPPRADFRWLSLSRPLGEFVLARVEANGIRAGARSSGCATGATPTGDDTARRPATISAIVHE